MRVRARVCVYHALLGVCVYPLTMCVCARVCVYQALCACVCVCVRALSLALGGGGVLEVGRHDELMGE